MVLSEMAQKMITSDVEKLIPNIYKAVVIMGTMPVSSCEAERSFSALRRIKNYMRTKCAEDRLSSLTRLHLERDVVNSVMENVDLLINDFASRHGRGHFFF